MLIKDFKWKSLDNLEMNGNSWLTDLQPKAVVFLVHGLGEHSGRYDRLAAFLNSAGYDLLSFDLRGHGQSQGKRGHTPSYTSLMDDIDHFILQSNCRTNVKFIYGHSLGGNLVLNYILRKKPKLDGVIATGPLLRTTHRVNGFMLAIGQIMNHIWPTLTMPNNINPKSLSHNNDEVNTYSKDILVHNRVSVRLGIDMLKAGEWALDHADEFPLPLLLMHGKADQVTSPLASQQFAEKMQKQCTLKLWPDFFHEIHNEIDSHLVLAFILNWLNKQTEIINERITC